MKKPTIYIAVGVLLLVVIGFCYLITRPTCNLTVDKQRADSAFYADSMSTHYCLENLLIIESEVGLNKEYPEAHVAYDTIWGAEGFFSMGTVMRTDSLSRIEVTWLKEGVKIGLVSATLVSDSDWYGDSIPKGDWKTCSGIYLGMSIEELQKLNGRPFTFYGFGWDYAGSVIDWQKGNLEGKGIAVQLAEGPTTPSLEISPEEMASVLGDVEVQSDNPVLKHYRPRVWSISVAKVQ